jgi:hypothetical protein
MELRFLPVPWMYQLPTPPLEESSSFRLPFMARAVENPSSFMPVIHVGLVSPSRPTQQVWVHGRAFPLRNDVLTLSVNCSLDIGKATVIETVAAAASDVVLGASVSAPSL